MKSLLRTMLIWGLAVSVTSEAAATGSPADTADFSARVAPYAVRIGTSFVINAVATEVLKSSVRELRPDRSDNDSWPSRHTSWATMAGAVVSHELYRKSPWWVLCSHAAVSGIAWQRTLSGAHYPKDVLGGMLTGLVSTELGYLIGGLVYPSARAPLPAAVAEFLPAVDVVTTALFPLCGGGEDVTGRTAVSYSVRAALPLSERFGVTVAANFRSMPLYAAGKYVSMIDGAGMSAGAVCYIPLNSRRFSAEARLAPGFIKNFHGEDVGHPGISFAINAGGGISCALTPALSVGCEAGYSLWALRSAVSAISLGFFTRASF